jgi:predicted Zn-dependent protease
MPQGKSGFVLVPVAAKVISLLQVVLRVIEGSFRYFVPHSERAEMRPPRPAEIMQAKAGKSGHPA